MTCVFNALFRHYLPSLSAIFAGRFVVSWAQSEAPPPQFWKPGMEVRHDPKLYSSLSLRLTCPGSADLFCWIPSASLGTVRDPSHAHPPGRGVWRCHRGLQRRRQTRPCDSGRAAFDTPWQWRRNLSGTHQFSRSTGTLDCRR